MESNVIDKLPCALGPIELARVQFSNGRNQILVWNALASSGSLHDACEDAYREALRQFFDMCERQVPGRFGDECTVRKEK